MVKEWKASMPTEQNINTINLHKIKRNEIADRSQKWGKALLNFSAYIILHRGVKR